MVPIIPLASVVVVIEEKNVKRFIQLERSTSEDKELYDSLMGEIRKLRVSPYHADNIPKRLIPKKYRNSTDLSFRKKYIGQSGEPSRRYETTMSLVYS